MINCLPLINMTLELLFTSAGSLGNRPAHTGEIYSHLSINNIQAGQQKKTIVLPSVGIL